MKKTWRKIKWKFEAFRTWLEAIPLNIKMICQWIPVLWGNWDWDYVFLLDVMRYKMARMSRCIAECDRGFDSQRHAKQLQACVDIIDRLRSDSYLKYEERQHEKKWGEFVVERIPRDDGLIKLDFYHVKARELGLEEQERAELRVIRNLAYRRRQKDLDVLFRIMRKRIEFWWD